MDALDRAEELLNRRANGEDEDHLWDSIANILYDIDPLDLNQNDFVRYLDCCRRNSWDIPSAIDCSHMTDGEVPEPPMHRDWDVSRFPNLRPIWEVNQADWRIIDRHFKDIHGLDLSDDRINWHFDT